MRFAAIVGALVIGACVRTAAVPCGDGTVCAPGTVCNIEHGQCLTPDQFESCVGKADGELCPVGRETGICDDELCFAVACGDGVVQGIEQCDGAPPQTSCFDLGYDAGFLGCNDAVCAADLPSCRHVGWKSVTAPSTGSVARLTSAGGVGYAVRGDLALRFRAGTWEPISSPSAGALVYSLYAAAADDVWAVTEDGLFRFDGTAWNRDAQIVSLDRGIITGAGPNDVYLFMTLLNGARAAMHFDGTTWSPIATPSAFIALAWSGPAGTFISTGTSVEKLSGGVWQSISHPLTSVHRLTGFGTTLILSGTSDTGAAVAIGDGATWSTYDISNELGWTTGAVLVGGRSPDDLYAIAQGQSQVARFDGERWLRDGTLPATGLVLDAIGTEMFAGTSEGIARASAAAFVEIADTLPASSSMAPNLLPFSVWGRACDDVFIAISGVSTDSAGQIVHFDGSAWTTELDVPMPLTAMSGSVNAAYAATYDGTLLRRSSSTWAPMGEPFPTPIRGISAAEDGTLALSGDERWLHVFDGGAWHSQQLPDTMAPSDILALSRDEVYAVDRAGLLRWDGASWSLEPLPQAGTARAIWGLPNGPLIVVGANGQAWHREQGAWRSMSMPFDEFLSVHGASPEDVFAVGVNGTLAHFAGEEWAPLRQRISVGRSVWNGASCTYFVGNSLPPSVARLRRSQPW